MWNVRDYFVSKPVLDHGYIELVDAMVENPLLKVVNSARVSFAKSSENLQPKDEKLIKYLSDHGHFSTFRHTYFSFKVKAPLFVFRQWWKYQIGSDWTNADELGSAVSIPDTGWNEVSGRYVEHAPEFYVPDCFHKQSASNKQGSTDDIVDRLPDGQNALGAYKMNIDSAYSLYKQMIDAGIAKEEARMVLPPSIYTECIWTCSIQTLVHFLTQRRDSHAQRHIRAYADAVDEIMLPILGSLLPYHS
jgi:thymidylate synthase (FAD)